MPEDSSSPADQSVTEGTAPDADEAASAQLAELAAQGTWETLGGKRYNMDDIADVKAYNADLKAINRKVEARAKEYGSKAKQFDELAEAQKTDLQKANDRATAAEAKATAAESQRLALLAAASNDLHPDLIPFLGSGTEDEINERAKVLAEVINERAEQLANSRNGSNGHQQPNGQVRRPVESLRAGGQPAEGQRPANPNDWFRQALHR
jgi:hypothetical protein